MGAISVQHIGVVRHRRDLCQPFSRVCAWPGQVHEGRRNDLECLTCTISAGACFPYSVSAVGLLPMSASKLHQSAVPKKSAGWNGSAAPVGLIELLTYRLHRVPFGAGKLLVTALEKGRVLSTVAL